MNETSGIEEKGNNLQETHLEAETAFETTESNLEQVEYTKEDPSSLFLEEKSLLPPTQDASKSSLPQPQASPKSLLPMTHDVVESSLPLPQLPFREEKSLLPLPQHAAECSSLVTPGILLTFFDWLIGHILLIKWVGLVFAPFFFFL